MNSTDILAPGLGFDQVLARALRFAALPTQMNHPKFVSDPMAWALFGPKPKVKKARERRAMVGQSKMRSLRAQRARLLIIQQPPIFHNN